MYNQELIIEKKVEFLKNQVEKIQSDFRNNLKPILLRYECEMFTESVLEKIQRDIDCFLERNELNIFVGVYSDISNQRLCFIGRTLIDELVWEQIQ
jgi:hypothetical protein